MQYRTSGRTELYSAAQCDNQNLRILHAIHDFLPRHRAGSEIYAFDLCRALSASHHVSLLCADYDPSRTHGHVTWRSHEGLPVVEIANNWLCGSFEDTYRPPLMNERIAQILGAVQPEVVHVHNLLNLSFDLPAIAHARGVPVVATLHDYALVCPAGGQRIHRGEQHVCHSIDPERCTRCFRESPFYSQVSFGKLSEISRAPGSIRRLGVAAAHRFPRVVGSAARAAARAPLMSITSAAIEGRLSAARRVFDEIDLFVAPSPSIAREFEQLGIGPEKIRVSDYGFAPLSRPVRARTSGPLRIGYVGTLVWHKGVHILVEAVRGLPNDSFELKIFGSLDVFPDYVADLRARSAGLPIQFMGAFDRERTAEVYEQIDVLVVPSLWLENSPLVIHEAFMAGIPVVGARSGGIVDLVKHEVTGLLYEPTSASALRVELQKLVDSPATLAALTGRAARVPIKSIGDDARDWVETYINLLGGQPAPRSA